MTTAQFIYSQPAYFKEQKQKIHADDNQWILTYSLYAHDQNSGVLHGKILAFTYFFLILYVVISCLQIFTYFHILKTISAIL